MALDLELPKVPCDSTFLYLFERVELEQLFGLLRDWMLAQIADQDLFGALQQLLLPLARMNRVNGVRHGLQQLIELEVGAVPGADRHEDRHGYHNRYPPPCLATQVGVIDLRIPKLRSGRHLPSIESTNNSQGLTR